jgi:chromosome segregation ATPase
LNAKETLNDSIAAFELGSIALSQVEANIRQAKTQNVVVLCASAFDESYSTLAQTIASSAAQMDKLELDLQSVAEEFQENTDQKLNSAKDTYQILKQQLSQQTKRLSCTKQKIAEGELEEQSLKTKQLHQRENIDAVKTEVSNQEKTASYEEKEIERISMARKDYKESWQVEHEELISAQLKKVKRTAFLQEKIETEKQGLMAINSELEEYNLFVKEQMNKCKEELNTLTQSLEEADSALANQECTCTTLQASLVNLKTEESSFRSLCRSGTAQSFKLKADGLALDLTELESQYCTVSTQVDMLQKAVRY